MSGYQGMRWLKCDLQVQTPEDGRHWDPEDSLKLATPRNEEDLQEKARRYLKRCHEVGLDVIGVTGHNFCNHRNERLRFLTHLIEQNATVAQETGRAPLWIFPGFEVDIGYHMLCLFPPLERSTGLDRICDVLTELGAGPGSRFDRSGPCDLRRDGRHLSLAELLRKVQGEDGGIVIAAHAFEEKGIAQDARYADDYRNEELLCVEVSGFALSKRERAVLEETSGKWARPNRPPAYICSSDAKSTLTDPEGRPKPNSLGYRSTWIKMSKPSIEALRQAFLDPEARIWRAASDPRPVRFGRIASLAVRGVAFLEDQEVFFSPAFNCLIGGRGSGKSSVFEYIRLTVRKEDDPAAADQVSRIRSTLTQESRLTLRWLQEDDAAGAPGLEDLFEFDPTLAKARIASRDVVDAATVFRSLGIQMFSQRQITAIAGGPAYLLELVDSLVEPRLQDLRREEREIRERVRELQQQRRNLERLEGERRALEQEVEELERKWKVRSAVQEEQARQRRSQEAQRYLDDLAARSARVVRDLGSKAQDFLDSHASLGSAARSWPEAEFFEALDVAVERAEQQLAKEVQAAADHFRARIEELTERSSHWPEVQSSIRAAEEDFQDACIRQGLAPEDLQQLLQIDLQRRAKALDLESKRAQEASARRAAEDLDAAWAQLHAIWKEETKARRGEMERILESEAVPKVPRLEGGRAAGTRPSIAVRIVYSGDREDFLKSWRELAPDARTRLGKQWEDLASAAFEAFLSDSPRATSPWEVVDSWLEGRMGSPSPLSEVLPALREHLSNKREDWEDKLVVRVRDSVDLILYRSDGSEAGSLRRKQLSDGQRNTAVLTLLLASGRGPILIDQPEDELDSNFIFQQLVPLLRKIKGERQVIVATHNPNLPVNGDAELVYALSAEASVGGAVRGVVRAQGGLDREDVKASVLDIMEGSEEAFRQRREKYHF